MNDARGHLGEMLSAYLDGELTRAEHLDVHQHLDECEQCRQELADLDSARTSVRSLPLLDPPFPLDVPSVVPLAKRRRRSVAAWVGAAAAVLLVGVVVVRDVSTEPPVDVATVLEQHTARVSVDPGLPAFRAVSLVDQP